MKYLCMFVAFKNKTNKSEKGEIRKNHDNYENR